MNDDSSEARNSTAFGDLLGAAEAAHRDVDEAPRGALGVLGEQLAQQRRVDGPGQRALTRTPRRANSTPISRVIASTPPFEAV